MRQVIRYDSDYTIVYVEIIDGYVVTSHASIEQGLFTSKLIVMYIAIKADSIIATWQNVFELNGLPALYELDLDRYIDLKDALGFMISESRFKDIQRKDIIQ